MCTPIVGMALTAVSTVAGMQAAQAQADYQAKVADNNAKIASKQAEITAEQGALEEKQLRQKNAQFAGMQRAAFSANGLDIAGGSPLGVLSDTAYLGELDAQTNRFNSAQKVWALKNNANDYLSQAQYARMSGNNAANGILLNGMSGLAGQYSTFYGSNKVSTPAGNSYYPTLAPVDYGGNYFIGNNNYTFANPMAKKTKTWW